MMNRTIAMLLGFARIIKALLYIHNIYWAKKLVEFGCPPGAFCLAKDSCRIHVKELNICLSRNKHLFFLTQFFSARLLRERANARFILSNSDEIIVEVGGLRAILQTADEIYMLREIFLDGVYSLMPVNRTVIWDVGMNVGLASLYFASKENVVGVISYEPFVKTYNQAKRNFLLNPQLSEKIMHYNFGVAGANANMILEYSEELRGQAGINGLSNRPSHGLEISREQVSMRSAGEVLDLILSKYPGVDVVAKMDCEGAEYEILSTLYAAGKLMQIKSIMLEWHYRGPEELVHLLVDSGFTTFSFMPTNKETGMIYAVRTSC